MQKKYAEKGLVCVSLNVDKSGEDPKDFGTGDKESLVRERLVHRNVETFLKDKGAAFLNFIVAEPKKDEADFKKLIGDYTATPYMVIFDRSGKKVWTIDEKSRFNEKQLEHLVEQELLRRG